MGVNRQYDGDLQMFVQRPREIDLAHLLFLRWLAERDRLEHPVAGPPRADAEGCDITCGWPLGACGIEHRDEVPTWLLGTEGL
jgi:hypothetical protein